MWPPLFWPGDDGETVAIEAIGLMPAPAIRTRYPLELVRNDDYTGARALYFPKQLDELWPELDGVITMTIRIGGTAVAITGTVATVDSEAMPKVEVPGASIPTAGSGVFDIEHVSGGVTTTLLMGTVAILADVTVPEPEE